MLRSPNFFAAFAVALALLLTCLSVTIPTSSAASSSVSVDGAQRFQHMDGFGVNANPKNWEFSDLTPAVDTLIGQMHATLWRVDIHGQSDWIDTPSHLNASYYSVIYETPDFQALWRTLSYLNAHGVRVVLSASGLVPQWMGSGGRVIDPSQEDNYVEMLTSVVDYGRRVKGIPITMLDPLNEPDLGPPEGPSVWQDQLDRIMGKLVTRLGVMGYNDVELLGPEPANVGNADNYMPVLLGDPQVMARIHHFAYHSYYGQAGDVDGWIRSSAYPDRNFWMTEWSQAVTDGFLDGGRLPADEWLFSRTMTDHLLGLIQQGAAAALAWDAWDNVHEHCGCHTTSRFGQLALDSATNTYSPRKRMYTNAQVFAFVPAGWQRVAANASDSSLRVVAFAGSTSGQVTLVGHNPNPNAVNLGITLANLGSVSSLRWYLTNASEDLVRQPDAVVTNGSLSVDIPADSFFSFTTLAASVPPAATRTPTLGLTPNATPDPSAPRTIDFTDAGTPNSIFAGQYPVGVLDWGTGAWWLAGPYDQIVSNSVSFSAGGRTTAPLTFVSPRRLLRIDADNGGTLDSTISLACPGAATVQVIVHPRSVVTIPTSWSGTCTTLTIGSSNGWDTNFNNLVIDGGAPVPTPTRTSSLTPTPARSLTPTLTPTLTRSLTPTPARSLTPAPTPTRTPTVTGGTLRSLAFDDLAGADRVLSGQYPSGVVDWGTNDAWFLSSPWGRFPTKSVSFSGASLTSASVTLLPAARLVQLDAYNGGTGSSTITLACAGHPTISVVLPGAGAIQTIVTRWSGTCGSVTIGSTNGWYTNFDNLVLSIP